ncbi:S-layer homology domain-containing protein [Paenibacillus ginsengarvi]|uniref:S-layer homology domain-containing protein n=1 Tax=Paenibacillus ginsengarvi TaxID=400777 RepID=A0A3B0B1X1_9BACL|nr:S-layer homology domain-containing protein [Paenibacillus ginsengarvi]RKN66119.1 hypothetical protein D7M11_31450 [Paenibacillus ginsengarvi]
MEAESVLADLQAAKTVTDALAALPAKATVTLADATAIASARQQYEALTAEQKALVTNLSRLMEAESVLADLQAAKTVTDALAALPAKATVTLADATAIASARQQYEALTPAHKALVTNVSRLTEAETALADLQAAKVVTDAIAALPAKATVTLADATALASARQQYEALTAEQKALVTNLSKLTDAEEALADLQAAKTVTDALSALPAKAAVTLADATAIASARQQYEALTPAQKSLVAHVSKLTEAEAALADLQTAKTVTDALAALPAKTAVTLADAVAIASARQQYEALTAEQKALVTNLSKLTDAEAALADLQAAKTLTDALAALPAKATVTLADATAIASVRQQYEALTPTQKALVTNVSKLTEAESALADLQAAKTLTDALAALPGKAAVTLADATAIASARQQYEALTPTQKALVTNVSKLTEAETALADLSVVSSAHSAVTAAPVSVVADGISSATITVTLRNAKMEPIEGKQVALTASGGRSVITAVYSTTRANGEAQFTVANTAAEQVTYGAIDITDQVAIVQKALVTFVSGSVSSTMSALSASALTVPADGTTASEITVTLMDAYRNPVTGKQVSLAASGGSSVITAVYATTNSSGQALFAVTNKAAETVLFAASDVTDRIAVERTVAVSFVYGVPPIIIMKASPEEATYGPVSVSVTAAVYGQFNAVKQIKWASGSRDIGYFAGNGTELTGGSFAVQANGTYTVYVKDAAGNENAATIEIANIVPLSRNADLQQVTVSQITLTPSFSASLQHYSASAVSGISSVTVAPTAADAFAVITVNGQALRSGQESSAITLQTGTNEIAIVVTAQDGVTSKTYTITIDKQKERSPDPAPSGGGEPTDYTPQIGGAGPTGSTATPGLNDTSIRISIDGRPVEKLVKTSRQVVGGLSLGIVRFDESLLNEALANSNTGTVIGISDIAETDGVIAEFTGDMIQKLANKQAVLELQTSIGGYELPAGELNLERLREAWGRAMPLSELLIQISAEKAPEADSDAIARFAAQNGHSIVSTPVQFKVTASYKQNSLELSRFGTFVRKFLPIPSPFGPNGVATAVVLNEDGTYRHVPTAVMRRDGRDTADIHSLTNSTYALISNRVKFNDTKDHWAEETVDDMGARLVVKGMEANRFVPDSPVTRAQFAAIVIRGLGLPEDGAGNTFNDVNESEWFSGAVGKAFEYGIVSGYEDGSFRPARTITREEAFVMIARAMKLSGLRPKTADQTGGALAAFPDRDGISAWAEAVVSEVVRANLANGSAEGLEPGRNLTRAETAVLIRRLLAEAGFI